MLLYFLFASCRENNNILHASDYENINCLGFPKIFLITTFDLITVFYVCEYRIHDYFDSQIVAIFHPVFR